MRKIFVVGCVAILFLISCRTKSEYKDNNNKTVTPVDTQNKDYWSDVRQLQELRDRMKLRNENRAKYDSLYPPKAYVGPESW